MTKPFRILCDDAGWCCQAGYLTLEDIKAGPTPQRRLTGAKLMYQWGMPRSTASEIVRRFRQGFIQCENNNRCILVKSGLKDVPVPSLSGSSKAFFDLMGQAIPVYRTTEWPIEPINPKLEGKIVSQSKAPWLWMGVHIDTHSTDIKLGDVLYFTPAIWGTVIDINGPIYSILLPGKLHGMRNKAVVDSAQATSDYHARKGQP